MRKSKFTESQIVAILAEGESGLALGDVCPRVRHQMTQVVDSYRSPYFFTTTTGSFAHF
jgi:hypothetical protein